MLHSGGVKAPTHCMWAYRIPSGARDPASNAGLGKQWVSVQRRPSSPELSRVVELACRNVGVCQLLHHLQTLSKSSHLGLHITFARPQGMSIMSLCGGRKGDSGGKAEARVRPLGLGSSGSPALTSDLSAR